MSESSSVTSFPGFGSDELRNLSTMEMVTGSGEKPWSTTTPAHTDHDDVSSRQGSLAASMGDSHTDQRYT